MTGVGDHLLRPLSAGAPIVYWQLGATTEARYDVPDQPMQGEMDPFFFLTKHKNFIPHEYPCRTAFGLARRNRRPDVAGRFAPERVWLPFGSPRVDLSGFWFRPTVIGGWARTFLLAEAAGPARLRLGTCGGAVLFVNGAEVGFIADYVRNLEAKRVFDVTLTQGLNEVRVWFDDLAERDARYFIQLDYLEGPPAQQALPAPAAAAAMIEATLEGMRFERPVYRSGEVALVLPAPLAMPAEASIAVTGDFISTEDPSRLLRPLRAGDTRIPLGPTETLPADFRHFQVALTAEGFTATRALGVEICHGARQGDAPIDLKGRIREALDEVSRFGEPDTVTALARLASGRAGAETDAMIAASLPAILECHDCADFALVPLLWCRIAHGRDIAREVVAEIDRAILAYRYWMDEPGNDVQWYFSENHALLFHTAAYLAGDLLPDTRFERSGRLGREQSAVGLARVRAWLDHFERWEMAEFNSAAYFPIDLKGLTALHAHAPDGDVRDRAGRAILRLLTIVARSSHHGLVTAAQGRSYEHTLRATGSLELSGIARLVWGRGTYGRRVHALPQMALCLRDYGLKVQAELAEVADRHLPGAQEWVFAQGQDRLARLYHYKSAAYAMGSAARYRWGEWGYQETVLHLRLGDNPDAQIWINHPGETIHGGHGRPSYWGGSGTLPRVHQYRGLAVMVFAAAAEQPDFTHAWFPRQVFDVSHVSGMIAFARSGDGMVLLKGSDALVEVDAGPTAGCELRLPGRTSTWIVRLGDRSGDGAEVAFATRFAGLEAVEDGAGGITIVDPVYGAVVFHDDGRIEAEGRLVDPDQWSVAGEARELPEGPTRAGPV